MPPTHGTSRTHSLAAKLSERCVMTQCRLRRTSYSGRPIPSGGCTEPAASAAGRSRTGHSAGVP